MTKINTASIVKKETDKITKPLTTEKDHSTIAGKNSDGMTNRCSVHFV